MPTIITQNFQPMNLTALISPKAVNAIPKWDKASLKFSLMLIHLQMNKVPTGFKPVGSKI